MLPEADVLALLGEWNKTCQPAWSVAELEHKIRSAAGGPPPDKGEGYLLNGVEERPGGPASRTPSHPQPQKPEYDPKRLENFAGDWNGKIDLLWLANRSVIDPATVRPEGFLSALYRSHECVYVARNDWGEGECIWPREPLPPGGEQGMKFLAQPIDGDWHPNPRSQKMSRRSAESVTSWRYMVLESDKAPARLWLAALAKLPLRVAAIYSSGGKSVHALIRLDAKTQRDWREMRERLMPGIVVLGADRVVMSSVRLTRLPGFFRTEKGQWQKLLYLNADPPSAPLTTFVARRDVEQKWWEFAASLGAQGWPEAKVNEALAAAKYYERLSTRLKQAAFELGEVKGLMEGAKTNE